MDSLMLSFQDLLEHLTATARPAHDVCHLQLETK